MNQIIFGIGFCVCKPDFRMPSRPAALPLKMATAAIRSGVRFKIPYAAAKSVGGVYLPAGCVRRLSIARGRWRAVVLSRGLSQVAPIFSYARAPRTYRVIPGEPWNIPGTLRDANGSLIDLSGATLEWALVDGGRNPVAITAEVTITDAAGGAICISVGANNAAGLDPGYYQDGLRVTMSRGERLTWQGHIQVDVNRFAA